jgi:sentrin-specific protease 1
VDRAPTPPPSPLMTVEELELFISSGNSEAHPHLGRCNEHQHDRVLTAFESTRAETCLFSRPCRSMVTKSEFRCLRHRQQLVDAVMNAHLDLLVDRDDADAAVRQRPQCHNFSTHFMTTLLQLGDPDPRKRGRYDFSQVHAWGDNCPGGDLFNLRLLLIPVHVHTNHWTLICVNFEESTIQYFDSCGGDGQDHMEHVLHYLQDEHQRRWGSPLPLPPSGSWRLRVNEATTPRQDNATDCGVFVCAFADLVLQGHPVDFNQTDVRHYRRRMANAILMGNIV